MRVDLDPNTVKQSHVTRALSYENAELKAKLAKFEQKEAERREKIKDQEEEDSVKVVLNQQKNELKLKSQGQVFSLKAFWGRYFREKKFREKLGFYSFDRSTRLAPFGDIGIADDGDFVLLDTKGNMLLRMERLKDLFQSVGALGNDISTGKIPLNMDKDGGYIENIMEYEVPELIPTNDGKLRFAKARKKPVYEIIQDLGNQLGQARSDLAESEAVIIELQNKIDAYESSNHVNETMAETSRAELKHNEERLIGIDRTFRQTTRDLVQARNLYVIQEDNLDKLEKELGKMRDEAEREGVKLSDDKALELIQRIRGTIVNELPDSPQNITKSLAKTPEGE